MALEFSLVLNLSHLLRVFIKDKAILEPECGQKGIQAGSVDANFGLW